MTGLLSTQNYISRLTTPTGVCHIYRNNLMGISNEDFEIILDRKMYEYNTDTLTQIRLGGIFEYDRKIIADALIFIHVWFEEHPNNSGNILSLDYNTYWNFFSDILTFIIEKEVDLEVVEMGQSLLESIREMQLHLNQYQGNFQDRLMKMELFVQAMLFLARI